MDEFHPFEELHYYILGKYIVPVISVVLLGIKKEINPLYWVFTVPILWGLIMLYCPDGAYNLPIPSLPGYHRFAPFWEQALALCIKFMFVEFLISSITFYNRNLKLGK